MDCKTCDEIDFETSYSDDIKDEMIKNSQCFICTYWQERVRRKHNKRQVVINGEVYQIGNNSDSFRGFGGRKHVIQFLDGRIVTSTDLWHNGVIPVHFRDQLPDNAKFIDIEKGKIGHGQGFLKDIK